jgi:hypothetical protein
VDVKDENGSAGSRYSDNVKAASVDWTSSQIKDLVSVGVRRSRNREEPDYGENGCEAKARSGSFHAELLRIPGIAPDPKIRIVRRD